MNNYLKPKLKQKKQNFLYQKMLTLQANSIAQRTKLLHESERKLENCWSKMCDIMRSGANPEEHETREIMSSCVEVIVQERVSLERESLELNKIKILHEKSTGRTSTSVKRKSCQKGSRRRSESRKKRS